MYGIRIAKILQHAFILHTAKLNTIIPKSYRTVSYISYIIFTLSPQNDTGHTLRPRLNLTSTEHGSLSRTTSTSC